MKNPLLIVLLVSLLLLTVALLYKKKPIVEPFSDLNIGSLLEKAQTDNANANALKEEIPDAIQTCKILGINLPETPKGSEPSISFQMSSVCNSETSVQTIRKMVSDVLAVTTPYFSSSNDLQAAQKAKLTIAKAFAAQAQANASTALAETAKERTEMKNITVKEEVKENPVVKAAESVADTKIKEAEAAKEQADRLEKISKETAQREADALKRAKAEKEAADALLLAAKADAEAAAAKAKVTDTMAKVETSPDAKKAIETLLEADKKAVETLNAVATAAEAKAEVAQAQVTAAVAAVEEKKEETKTTDSATAEKLAAEEELRKKLNASQIAEAEAARKKSEEAAQWEIAQVQLKRDAQDREERRLYATDKLNKLLQAGIIQQNSDAYMKILNAQSKSEIDTLASQATAQAESDRKKRLEDEEVFNRRLKELNEARQGRAILSREEELAILGLKNEGEFQAKKQAVKLQVDEMIRKEEEERQKKIDEMNRIEAEKEKKRLAELMAMSPTDRAKSQLDEAKIKQDTVIAQAAEKFEAYKKRLLATLVNVERIISADVAARLSALPTHEDFDREVRVERMKNESPSQKAIRETEEAKFQAYKIEDTNNLLKADAIFSDAETLSKLRAATNYDRYTELSQIEIQRKRQNYFTNQLNDATTAQSQALFAQNMEPIRTQLVESANKEGVLSSEQYARLKVTSINTQEKFQAVENEIKKAQKDARDAREAETQRKIAAAEAERKAREEAERKRKEEEERLAQEDFLKRRQQEVDIISTGMFPITENQKQDLLNTNDRLQFVKKKEQYILQAYGGTRKEGESLADFFNRRRDEVVAEQALAESRKRDEQQKADKIAQLFQTNQANLNSSNRFWKAEAEANLRILNAIKARNLSNTDFLKEWENLTMSDAERLQRENERKFDETQQKLFKTKDADGYDINFYRLFKYTMPAQFPIKNKTAQECVDEVAKNPKAGGFLREAGIGNDQKADCWVNEWGMQFAKPSDSAINVYARYNELQKIPDAASVVGSQAFSEATAIDQAISTQKAAAEAKKKEDAKRAQKAALDSASEMLTVGGKKFLVFKGYRFNNDEGWLGSVQSSLGSGWDPTLAESISQLASKGAKSFARSVQKWPAGTGYDISRDRAISILYSDSNPYNLSATFDPRFATYIPVENLPAEFRTAGFTDYSPIRQKQNTILNQNNFNDRVSRTQNYTFFHPAL